MILDLLWWLGWALTAAVVAAPLALVPVIGPVAATVATLVLAPWTTLLALAGLQRLMPESEAGTFTLPGDAGATRWAMRSWAPSVYLTLFQPLFFNSVGFQRLVLRAFGARMGAGAWVTSRTIVREPHHVTVGARSMIGEFAHLICAMQPRPGRLVVAPVVIGEDTLVAAYSHVGPGCVIGSRCIVEHAVALAPFVTVGDDACIGAGTAIYVAARIGRGAVVGKHCVIPAKWVVADGERIPDGTVLGAHAQAAERPRMERVEVAR